MKNREYLGDSKISSAERDFLLQQPAIALTAIETIQLAQAAAKRHTEFYEWIKPRMSKDLAGRVRQLRCTEGLSYRSIAVIGYLELGADWNHWWPVNNQIAGVALCEVAAEHFGEDFAALPWQANLA